MQLQLLKNVTATNALAAVTIPNITSNALKLSLSSQSDGSNDTVTLVGANIEIVFP